MVEGGEEDEGVEDGEDEGEEEVEAEAEEEEEEDGEDVEVDHGLVTGPKYVNWLAEPIPNSSMLVFPTMTAPADWRGWGNGGGGGWGCRGGWQWRGEGGAENGGDGPEERLRVGVSGGEGGSCARDSFELDY